MPLTTSSLHIYHKEYPLPAYHNAYPMARRLRPEEYTVGWICALPVELAAAQEVLDEEHENLEPGFNNNDENIYALGSIGGHNVAIVCLPAGRIGNNPAASVATQMRATFKAIRFGLMVGIGGGVPSVEADIWLGDVVVSQPHQTASGVVQYDSGKTTLDGFQRTGSLNSPPQILLGAVSQVRANQLRGRSKLPEHISKLERLPGFQRKIAGPDVLFEATYHHEGGHTCTMCRIDKRKARQPRENNEVVVHYGTIASGNQVMKNGFMRDKLSREFGGVLCFEMEAAGLMNTFPCLVIRGICDYADSHKNERWQPYAAVTAAAYAKEVLSVIPACRVAEQLTLDDAMYRQRVSGSLLHAGVNSSPANLVRKGMDGSIDEKDKSYEKCFKCGEAGHWIYECPKIMCFQCKRFGHIKADCTHRDVVCYNCGIWGHGSNTCWI
ncbi:nucleoside phosphorylase domain-containing protein [Dendryphion nanum]|uniref:Nucleoside phosphorylase domain-containing protein n=1 Tax=Dendryphion nanum TaxID=256645 RepID=A0A9P9D277_9PLEO|nr:nucleoside phosphorylase domain-containing protein [Dendryphion nanum]